MTSTLRCLVGSAVAGLVVAVLGPAVPAAADTPPLYSTASTTTRFAGQAFDTCVAPTAATMGAWRASPFRAVGIYVSGRNRGCPTQPNLTPTWVRTVSRAGWKLVPIHVGLQAPCYVHPTRLKMSRNLTTAAAQGRTEADQAVAAVRALGMLSGTAIYVDIENYDSRDVGCRNAVLRFVSSWTDRMHERGMLAGVYSNATSGIGDLAAVHDNPAYSRPDAVWFARWNEVASVFGDPSFPDTRWRSYQRMKQYRGDHIERWGGVSINIDSNIAQIMTASVRYGQRTTAAVNLRVGPSTSSTILRVLPAGTPVDVVCQIAGRSVISGTRVWNRLTNGGYVHDLRIDTASSTGFTAPIPQCSTAFQVTAATLNARRTPSTTAAVAGTVLLRGQLAHVVCQARGQLVGTDPVWNRLVNGTWVSDLYVRSASRTSWSAPLPRC